MSPAAAVVLAIVFAGVPPLTSSQRTRIETARDGRDHREAAFVALVENMAAWSGELGGATIRLEPDLAAMIAEPTGYRGDLCRLSGVIQQRTELGPPHDGVSEWFIRDEEGVPILVYIAAGLADEREPWRDGQRVVVAARFYKPVEFSARDGEVRRYAAFVGAHPRRTGASTTGDLARLWLITVPVAVLFATFLALLFITRRARGDGTDRPLTRPDPRGEVDDTGPLPDDPAEALAELRRRAGTR